MKCLSDVSCKRLATYLLHSILGTFVESDLVLPRAPLISAAQPFIPPTATRQGWTPMMRVAPSYRFEPVTSPATTRAIFSPPTEEGSIGLA